jgi:hypothetical protein
MLASAAFAEQYSPAPYISLVPQADERTVNGKGDPVAIECASDDEETRNEVQGKLLKIVITRSPKWGTIWRADVAVPHAPPPSPPPWSTPRAAGPWRVVCAMPGGNKFTVVGPITRADDMISTADFLGKCQSEYDYCKSLVISEQGRGLVLGVRHIIPQSFCAPPETTLSAKDRVAAVLTWISKHPEMGSKFISQSVQVADANLWPCTK